MAALLETHCSLFDFIFIFSSFKFKKMNWNKMKNAGGSISISALEIQIEKLREKWGAKNSLDYSLEKKKMENKKGMRKFKKEFIKFFRKNNVR